MTLPLAAAATDRALSARAAVLATRARGRTAPNPHVGCVLSVDGGIVGEGVTAPVGGPHAEVVALTAAGDAARGATAHVTLEPCGHHGRTPPCTDALVAAGVTRVVIAHPDPNPQAAGGAQRLRAAGVEVEVLAPRDPLRAAVADELAGFLSVVTGGRPHLTLKLAQSLDGALTATRRWLTGPAARRAVHRWRATADAVLVGSGTVLADDPRLDVRDVPLGERPQPRPVVLDSRLRTPPQARIVARGALVLTTPATLARAQGAARARALEVAGAEVVAVAPTSVATEAAAPLELPAALATLAAAGVNTVFAEPGATLARALVAADLVDRLVLHVAELEVAPRPDPTRGGGFTPAVVVPPDRFATRRLGGAGPDVVWERTRASAHTTTLAANPVADRPGEGAVGRQEVA